MLLGKLFNGEIDNPALNAGLELLRSDRKQGEKAIGYD
jgi:hypothetical protein